MNIKEHYDGLRTEMQKGKSPQQRLGIFTAGVAGLVEQHAENPGDLRAISQELTSNTDAWSKLVFETRV